MCLAIGCPTAAIPVSDRAPAFTASAAQGGARLSATSGRVDWSVSVFRGFESFGLYTLEGVQTIPPVLPPFLPADPPTVAVVYPRFTMIGGDFEAVRGKWGLRGEAAAFVDDNFQSADLRVVTGHSIRCRRRRRSTRGRLHAQRHGARPLGVLRRAADGPPRATRVATSATGAPTCRWSCRPIGRLRASVIASGDSASTMPTTASGFVRGIGMASLRDNLALEASIGWFAGDGRDLIARFGDSDFVYVRFKYDFSESDGGNGFDTEARSEQRRTKDRSRRAKRHSPARGRRRDRSAGRHTVTDFVRLRFLRAFVSNPFTPLSPLSPSLSAGSAQSSRLMPHILLPALNASTWTGPTGTNTYLLPGPFRRSSTPASGSQSTSTRSRTRSAASPLALVLITHGHSDHVNGVPAHRRALARRARQAVRRRRAADSGWRG